MFPLGHQTVGIVSRAKVLDEHGKPVLSEAMEPEIRENVIPKAGCSFEIQVMPRPGEVEQLTGGTTVIMEIAWVQLPIDRDTADGESCLITSDMALRYPYPGGKTYEMRSDGHVEPGSHVFCMAERQAG